MINAANYEFTMNTTSPSASSQPSDTAALPQSVPTQVFGNLGTSPANAETAGMINGEFGATMPVSAPAANGAEGDMRAMGANRANNANNRPDPPPPNVPEGRHAYRNGNTMVTTNKTTRRDRFGNIISITINVTTNDGTTETNQNWRYAKVGRVFAWKYNERTRPGTLRPGVIDNLPQLPEPAVPPIGGGRPGVPPVIVIPGGRPAVGINVQINTNINVIRINGGGR